MDIPSSINPFEIMTCPNCIVPVKKSFYRYKCPECNKRLPYDDLLKTCTLCLANQQKVDVFTIKSSNMHICIRCLIKKDYICISCMQEFPCTNLKKCMCNFYVCENCIFITSHKFNSTICNTCSYMINLRCNDKSHDLDAMKLYNISGFMPEFVQVGMTETNSIYLYIDSNYCYNCNPPIITCKKCKKVCICSPNEYSKMKKKQKCYGCGNYRSWRYRYKIVSANSSEYRNNAFGTSKILFRGGRLF